MSEFAAKIIVMLGVLAAIAIVLAGAAYVYVWWLTRAFH